LVGTSRLTDPRSPGFDWLALAYRAKFRAHQLARLAGMHERTLRRFFRRRFRTTPQRWLDRHRLRAAQRLLRRGGRTKEVAYALGYSHVSQFCRQFKRACGVSPQRWR
jgi:AraC-like DNA-binding protein